ncbi:MAG: hypothetical protein RIR69_235 [Actinomycetota bacterium]
MAAVMMTPNNSAIVNVVAGRIARTLLGFSESDGRRNNV